MLMYLDMTCLQRPFDDQSDPTIRAQSDAALTILALESDSAKDVEFIRSHALLLENQKNPSKERARRIKQWLNIEPMHPVHSAMVHPRLDDLLLRGFSSFDALHLAIAHVLDATAFVTCDERLLAIAQQQTTPLRVPILNVLDAAKEYAK